MLVFCFAMIALLSTGRHNRTSSLFTVNGILKVGESKCSNTLFEQALSIRQTEPTEIPLFCVFNVKYSDNLRRFAQHVSTEQERKKNLRCFSKLSLL